MELEYRPTMVDWDEKVAPRLSKIRQGCFWIGEEVKDIMHAIRLIEGILPEWPTEAIYQLMGTVRELREAADKLEIGILRMESATKGDKNGRKDKAGHKEDGSGANKAGNGNRKVKAR